MKILIIKLSALGDIISSLPVAVAIQKQQPSYLVDWLVEKPYATILEKHPALNDILISPYRSYPIKKRLRDSIGLIRLLHNRHYNAVLEMQGLIKSAIHILVSRGDRKIGFRGGKEPIAAWALTEHLLPYDPERPALERYLDFLKPLGLERPIKLEFGLRPKKNDINKVQHLFKKSLLLRPLVLLHPVAKWKSKLWPLSHWIQLARLLAKENINLALTGSSQDQLTTQYITKQANLGISTLAGSIYDLAGQTNLKTLAALQSLASAVVSTDTGTMHLAAAVGTPVIALFGPTSPKRTGPYGLRHKILSLALACQPCFRRRCLQPRCLENLRPALAAQAVFEILKR